MEPYRGLQPYTEQDEAIFFGREAEKAILIDKMLSDKLTLLFAASGVGKSSLLQAAVMPELKRPSGENLDVVYYHDWVINPLHGLQQAVLHLLQERGKLSPPSDTQAAASPSLKEFLQRCAEVASEPLVIILDQFEEFFQYQQYAAAFTPFIEQLAEAIRDRATPVVFLISMREDFALNLNAFKENLPNIFDHYYRLEKLSVQTAETAIRKPVENLNFRYEPELLAMLLRDLADEERENRIGTQKAEIPDHAPRFVEAPNVQIVCTQLWEMERANPEKILRANTYTEHGGVKGFITIYFQRVMTDFSAEEKRIASKAFDHLVTPRGTKLAYPLKDLSDKLRKNENALANVLAKLDKARVLRGQSRAGVIWYELYHDVFSDIIYHWNTAYKFRQRTRRAVFGFVLGVCAFGLLFVAYDIVSNLTSYHLRLSAKNGISDQIELYHGNIKSRDIVYIQRYETETSYERNQLEPDKLFMEKSVGDYDNLNIELIGNLPIVERISAYWAAGESEKALELADKSISQNDLTRTQEVINLLIRFQSQKAFDVLKKHLFSKGFSFERIISFFTSIAYASIPAIDTNSSSREYIISAIRSTKFKGVSDCLVQLLNDKESNVRSSAVEAIGYQENIDVIDKLLMLLEDDESTVQFSAIKALARLSSNKDGLNLLRGNDSFKNLLIARLKDKIWKRSYQDSDEIIATSKLLAKIDIDKTLNFLTETAQNTDITISNVAISALNQLSHDEAVIQRLRQNYRQQLIQIFEKQLPKQIKQLGASNTNCDKLDHKSS